MRGFSMLAIGTVLALAAAGLPSPAAAEKMADLKKDGYSCGNIGAGGYECTKKDNPGYYCDREGTCVKKRVASTDGSRAPTSGVLDPGSPNPGTRGPSGFRPGGMLQGR